MCGRFTVNNVKFCIKLCAALINIITSNLHLYPSFLPLSPVDLIPYVIHPVIWTLHPEQTGNIRNKVEQHWCHKREADQL